MKTEALKVLRGNPIAEAHALWLESVALTTPSQRTVRNYESTTRPFLTFLYERQKTDLDAVQPHDIRAYLLQLKNAFGQARLLKWFPYPKFVATR